MNTFTYLFSSNLSSSIGWTLIHSLWQGLVILFIIMLLNKFSKTSSARYTIALTGLIFFTLLGLFTFVYLHAKASTLSTIHSTLAAYQLPFITTIEFQHTSTNSSWRTILQSNMNFIVMGWVAGAIIFLLRIVGGSVYVSSLRKSAVIVRNDWSMHVSTIANRLSIHRLIMLAESTRVHAPVVLGYIKPVILVPAEMLSGLPSEQIEMILMHELMHIKRHDYIVNIMQLVLESIFFFNPAVWILSETIRKEREFCCDDAVVRYRPNALAYASALARLEELRFTKVNLAMGLAQNKNQLLNRIKRLMENSVKPYSLRERMVPALLLVIGLMCASWLTISKGRDNMSKASILSRQDTSIHKKNKSSSYYRGSITISNENAPGELIEAYNIEDDVFAFIAVPDVELPEIPEIRGIPDFNIITPVMPPIPDYIYEYDTVPGKQVFFSFYDFEKFSKDFEKNFTEQFGCKTRSPENTNQMSKHVEETLEKSSPLEITFRAKADMQLAMAIQKQVEPKIMATHAHEAELHTREMAQQSEAFAKSELDMKRMQTALAQQMKGLETNMKKMEDNMKRFEDDLQRELVRDGYLKSGQQINNIQWSNDAIKINDISIKDEHDKKYRAIHDKHFIKSNLN